MNAMEKKMLINAKYNSDRAADNTRDLLDSKFVENYLTEKELKALGTCAEFLTKIETKMNKLYDKEKPWND